MQEVSWSKADIRRMSVLGMQRRIDDQYSKAQKRARKNGREIPPKEEYYHNYWGYPYLMYGPWVSNL